MKITVNEKRAAVTEAETLTVGSSVTIAVDFSSDWDGMAKTAQFYDGTHLVDKLMTGNTVTIPAEVMADRGNVSVAFIGIKDGKQVATVECRLGSVWYGERNGAIPPEPPTPGWSEQIETALEGKLDKKPIDMKTTADTQPVHIDSDGKLWTRPGGGGSGGGTTDYNALDNRPSINGHTLVTGMTSTELGIKDGKDGRDGENGTPGTDGVSPVTVLSPITGGTRLVITDAKGEHTADILNGKDGKDGTNGKDGANGKDGTPGRDGKDGAPGKDAAFGYEESAEPTADLKANVFHKFTAPSATITVTTTPSTGYAEYSFQFTTASSGGNLSIPAEFAWNGGKAPELKPNMVYQVVLFSGTAYISGGVPV